MSGREIEAVAQYHLDWQQSTIIQSLDKTSIHVWLCDLSAITVTTFESALTEAELRRSQKIKDKQKRKLYLGGRLGLRHLLSHYSGVPNHALKFGYGLRGKPMLLEQPLEREITFNYTLSKDKALYAVAIGRHLGVDLEVLPRKINDSLMAKRHLTESEQLSWQGLPDSRKHDGMLCCWTRKEAYGKALGVGVRYQMNQVTLFSELQSAEWAVTRSGLFTDTDSAGMADQFRGLQLALPIAGMASLVYEDHANSSPSILAAQLIL